jgi:hypothetical protein
MLTLSIDTCKHLKLSIFMPFEIFFCYIQKYLSLGFFFGKGEDTQFWGFFNVDYTFDLDDWTSTTTYSFLLGSTPISWCCLKQNSVSWLSCEFEYWLLANCCCEDVWIHWLLHELGIDMNALTTIMCHNQTAIKFSKNPIFHDKTKHFEVDWHFIQEKVEEKII